jgi:hypothetical protein
LLDSKAVSIELVNQSGSPLKTTVKGFQGLQAGSPVTVKGKVVKSGKNVRVVATGVYVG